MHVCLCAHVSACVCTCVLVRGLRVLSMGDPEFWKACGPLAGAMRDAGVPLSTCPATTSCTFWRLGPLPDWQLLPPITLTPDKPQGPFLHPLRFFWVSSCLHAHPGGGGNCRCVAARYRPPQMSGSEEGAVKWGSVL